MLILAGVSLNAIVGDNGIITNAQDANMKSKIAALQDYIDQYYIENFDGFDKYGDKISALKANKKSSNWIYQGKMGYVLDKDGNVHYYLNYSNLPKEMKDIIGGFEEKTYADYVDGDGLYGLTEDLKVYYQTKENNNLSYIGISNPIFKKESGSTEVISGDTGLSDLIGGNTVADTRKVTNLSINDSTGVSNLNDFYNFINLDKLVLNDLTDFESLDGIEYCTSLRAIFIQNCKIKDYSALAKVPNLQDIFFYWTSDEEIEKFCSNENGIGGKDITSLRHFGIYGAQHFSFDYSGIGNHDDTRREYYVNHSKFSQIELLSNLSEKTKQSIRYLYLNNNSITNIENIWEFSNITVLRIESNYITSLNGMYNENIKSGITKCKYIFTNHNNLGKNLENENLNPELDSLSNFSKTIFSNDKYTFEAYLNNIVFLDLSYNNDLKYVDYLKPLITVNELWLLECNNLNTSSVLNIANIISKGGGHVNNDFAYYLAVNDPKLKKADLSGRTLTKTTFENVLKSKENLLSLNLKNINLTADDGSEISNYNEVINNALKNVTTLQYLSLNGMNKLTTVDFIEGTRNLVELDLRGTSATDLSKLYTYMTSCKCLVLDNPGIDVTKIQNCFNRVSDGMNNSLAWVRNEGIQLTTTSLVNQITNCTKITKAFWKSNMMPWGCTVDLRKCTGLTNGDNIYVLEGYAKFYFPTTLTGIGNKGYGAFQCEYDILNPEELVNVKYFAEPHNDWIKYANICNRLPNINEINFYNGYSIDLRLLTNPEKYKIISLFSYSGSASTFSVGGDESLNALVNFTNLESFSIGHCKKFTKLPDCLANLTKLSSVNFYNTGLTEIEVLKDLPNLISLKVTTAPMRETGFRVDSLGNSITVDNMEVIKNLNSKKLKKIYLDGTKISDFSKISELTWEDKGGF